MSARSALRACVRGRRACAKGSCPGRRRSGWRCTAAPTGARCSAPAHARRNGPAVSCRCATRAPRLHASAPATHLDDGVVVAHLLKRLYQVGRQHHDQLACWHARAGYQIPPKRLVLLNPDVPTRDARRGVGVQLRQACRLHCWLWLRARRRLRRASWLHLRNHAPAAVSRRARPPAARTPPLRAGTCSSPQSKHTSCAVAGVRTGCRASVRYAEGALLVFKPGAPRRDPRRPVPGALTRQ